MARRSRQKQLTQVERERFIAAATALHHACCEPRLAIGSDADTALKELNQAICEAVRKVTGNDPHWMVSGPSSFTRKTFGAFDT